MAPAPQGPFSTYGSEGFNEWDIAMAMKQLQGQPGMIGQFQDMGMQPVQGYYQSGSNTESWRGELASNLMALPSQEIPVEQNFDFVGDMQTSQMQPVSQMTNIQGQMMQVIVLPLGAAPPAGAIAVSPGSDSLAQEPVMQGQIITVAAGEAPPEGAQFIGTMTGDLSQSEATSPTRQNSRALKIKDPRTGREVCAPGEETAALSPSRRMRIVNPKTGEEVRL